MIEKVHMYIYVDSQSESSLEGRSPSRIWGLRKEDRKSNKHSIIINPLRFENLSNIPFLLVLHRLAAGKALYSWVLFFFAFQS
jgi:hypothetical protein